MSKITIDRAPLEQALEWFEWFHNGSTIASPASSTQVMRTLRESLTQPQPGQEPVAELEAANAELLKALKGVTDELLDVLYDINNDRIPFDGDEFHERLEAGKAAIKKHGGAA